MYDEGCVEERKLSGLIRAGCAVVEAALTSQPRGEMLKHSPTRDLSSNYKEQAGMKNQICIYTVFRRAQNVSNFLAEWLRRQAHHWQDLSSRPGGGSWNLFVFSSFFLATTAFSPLLFFFSCSFLGWAGALSSAARQAQQWPLMSSTQLRR